MQTHSTLNATIYAPATVFNMLNKCNCGCIPFLRHRAACSPRVRDCTDPGDARACVSPLAYQHSVIVGAAKENKSTVGKCYSLHSATRGDSRGFTCCCHGHSRKHQLALWGSAVSPNYTSLRCCRLQSAHINKTGWSCCYLHREAAWYCHNS